MLSTVKETKERVGSRQCTIGFILDMLELANKNTVIVSLKLP